MDIRKNNPILRIIAEHNSLSNPRNTDDKAILIRTDGPPKPKPIIKNK